MVWSRDVWPGSYRHFTILRFTNWWCGYWEDRNAPITADLPDINGAMQTVIILRSLAVSSRNVTVFISSDYIERQTILQFIIASTTMNNNLFLHFSVVISRLRTISNFRSGIQISNFPGGKTVLSFMVNYRTQELHF